VVPPTLWGAARKPPEEIDVSSGEESEHEVRPPAKRRRLASLGVGSSAAAARRVLDPDVLMNALDLTTRGVGLAVTNPEVAARMPYVPAIYVVRPVVPPESRSVKIGATRWLQQRLDNYCTYFPAGIHLLCVAQWTDVGFTDEDYLPTCRCAQSAKLKYMENAVRQAIEADETAANIVVACARRTRPTEWYQPSLTIPEFCRWFCAFAASPRGLGADAVFDYVNVERRIQGGLPTP
jgi:hypothetical protein